MNEISAFYLLLGLFLLTLVLWIILIYHIEPQRHKLKSQDLIRNDQTKEKTYYSKKYGIMGKPDIVKEIAGEIIPIEVKSTIYKGKIYSSHIMQIAAYCLLIEEETGKRPPYGIIKYKRHQEKIYYTKELQKNLLLQIERIREENPEENDLPPVCNNQKKCRHCGYNYICFTGQKRLL